MKIINTTNNMHLTAAVVNVYLMDKHSMSASVIVRF